MVAGKSTIFKRSLAKSQQTAGILFLQKGKQLVILHSSKNLISGNSIYEELKTAKADIIRLEEQIRTIEHELKGLSG